MVYTHEEGLQWCLQMARGLERLHTSSPVIVHRDLKLENILLTGAHPAVGLKKLENVSGFRVLTG